MSVDYEQAETEVEKYNFNSISMIGKVNLTLTYPWTFATHTITESLSVVILKWVLEIPLSI